MSGKNVNQRVKSRRSGAKAWEVGSSVNGIGNYLYGRKSHLRARVPLSNTTTEGLLNSLKVSSTNQLGGVGRYKSQFITGADSVNFNVLNKQIFENIEVAKDSNVPDTDNTVTILEGTVSFAYIAGASGIIMDLCGNTIGNFETDQDGRFLTEVSNLPELFKLQIISNGIDIITNQNVGKDLTLITTINNINNLNINPIANIISRIAEKESILTENKIDVISNNIASKLGISPKNIKGDYISNREISMTKVI